MTSLSWRLPTSPGMRQLVRFLVVGCLNVAITFVVFVFCYRYLQLGSRMLDAAGTTGHRVAAALAAAGIVAIDAAAANFIGYLAGMANSFVLNKLWTFEATGRTFVQAQRFVVLNVVSLLGSTLVMFIFVDLLAVPYLPVFVATVALTTIFHFFGNRHWTFASANGPARSGHGAGR